MILSLLYLISHIRKRTPSRDTPSNACKCLKFNLKLPSSFSAQGEEACEDSVSSELTLA